jgi:hypothetical protein
MSKSFADTTTVTSEEWTAKPFGSTYVNRRFLARVLVAQYLVFAVKDV